MYILWLTWKMNKKSGFGKHVTRTYTYTHYHDEPLHRTTNHSKLGTEKEKFFLRQLARNSF